MASSSPSSRMNASSDQFGSVHFERLTSGAGRSSPSNTSPHFSNEPPVAGGVRRCPARSTQRIVPSCASTHTACGASDASGCTSRREPKLSRGPPNLMCLSPGDDSHPTTTAQAETQQRLLTGTPSSQDEVCVPSSCQTRSVPSVDVDTMTLSAEASAVICPV